MYKKVIVTSDGSKEAKKGIKKGLNYAKSNNLPVVGLYVMPALSEWLEGMRKPLKELGEKALKDIKEIGKEVGIEVETKELVGKPHVEITDFADEDDIIFIGAHGHSGISGYLIGGTADKVVKRAKCTVTVVK